jgi:hypothetical protein
VTDLDYSSHGWLKQVYPDGHRETIATLTEPNIPMFGGISPNERKGLLTKRVRITAKDGPGRSPWCRPGIEAVVVFSLPGMRDLRDHVSPVWYEYDAYIISLTHNTITFDIPRIGGRTCKEMEAPQVLPKIATWQDRYSNR